MLELSNTLETMLVDNDGGVTSYSNAQAKQLFQELRKWRLNEAAIIQLPAYCVLENNTLRHIVDILPTDLNMLWLVPGMRFAKIDTYGKSIIETVKGFLAENNISKVLYGKNAITVTAKNEALIGYLGLIDYFSEQ